MEERRSRERRKTLKGARILINEGKSTIDCVVRNVSATGAKLTVASVVGIPDSFILINSDGSRRKCRVIWRALRELGVAFVSELG
jgi:hypothetical protein